MLDQRMAVERAGVCTDLAFRIRAAVEWPVTDHDSPRLGVAGKILAHPLRMLLEHQVGVETPDKSLRIHHDEMSSP
jgi:hypothetical protein